MKWEYKKIELEDVRFFPYKDDVDQMNDIGKEGWELCSVIYTRENIICYWKRQIPVLTEEE